jgi:hypothetical protein
MAFKAYRDRFLAVLGPFYFVPLFPEDLFQQSSDFHIILDYENPHTHPLEARSTGDLRSGILFDHNVRTRA